MKKLILCSATAAVLILSSCSSGGTQAPPKVVAVTPVGTARGSAVQKMVPTGGATIISADGRLKLEVPSGAVATSTMLTIQAINNQAPGGLGTAYRLGPEGTTFSTPVKLTFTYGNADIAGSEPLALKIAYQDSKGSWNAVKSLTLDTLGKTVSVQTKHFSDWSMVAGFQLRPPIALVKAGGTVDLVVNVCSNNVPGHDDLAELLNRCQPDPDFFTIQQWSVNGVTNGNSTVGTIKAAGETSATYQSPSIAPAANPVAVSASMTDKATRRKTTLISNIFIDANPPLEGTINSTQVDEALGFTLSSTAKLTFEYDSAQQMYLPKAGGTLKAGWDAVIDGCETHATFEVPIAITDGNIVVTDLGYFPSGRTTGTFVGTTTCKVAPGSQPFMVTHEVQWWPTSIGSIFGVKPDGTFNEMASYVVADTNQKITTDWALVPLANP